MNIHITHSVRGPDRSFRVVTIYNTKLIFSYTRLIGIIRGGQGALLRSSLSTRIVATHVSRARTMVGTASASGMWAYFDSNTFERKVQDLLTTPPKEQS